LPYKLDGPGAEWFNNSPASQPIIEDGEASSGEQLRAGRRELHVGAGFMLPQPALGDRQLLEARALFGRAASSPQEGQIDLLDMDPAVLDRLDAVGDLDQLAGGGFRISVGTISDELLVGVPRAFGGRFLGLC
jgi:hypothetical protein